MTGVLADPIVQKVVIVVIESVVMVFVVMTAFAYVMLAERKVLGWFQMRVGPTWCGPWVCSSPRPTR